jgi:hypothetical protein
MGVVQKMKVSRWFGMQFQVQISYMMLFSFLFEDICILK